MPEKWATYAANGPLAQAMLDDLKQYEKLKAAAQGVVEAWDRWTATVSSDRPAFRDLDALIDALRAATTLRRPPRRDER